jgi:hypothetical protein
MKPRELYSGAAPAAMAQMGQGISEAGARIGQTLQQGYQSMGQGLSQGITAAANVYGDYKKMSSQVKADSAAFDALKDYMPKDVAESFDMQRKAIETDPSTSLQDRASFYNSAKSFLGSSIQHRMEMDKVKAQLEAQKQMPFYNAGAQGLLQSMGQDSGLPQKGAGYGGGIPSTGYGQPMIIPRNYINNF